MPEISAKSKVCAVIGHPIGHSLSPAIHNAAFAAIGLDYAYVAHDVLPERVPEAIAGMRALGYRGLSVTIPHKVAALACADEVDATARAIGCINTIVNDEGCLRGYNSDGRGALNALRAASLDPAGKRVVVLGSGGAARAVAMTLALESAPRELLLLGVVEGELDALRRDIASRSDVALQAALLEENELRAVLPRTDLLLQCTPVGMHPNTNQTLVPRELLHERLGVFDAVYNPRRTKLLEEAAAAGARIVQGLEMFLGQAAVQFELWTGQPAPLEVMRRVLEERL
jgi:shikimate dehydrogenase